MWARRGPSPTPGTAGSAGRENLVKPVEPEGFFCRVERLHHAVGVEHASLARAVYHQAARIAGARTGPNLERPRTSRSEKLFEESRLNTEDISQDVNRTTNSTGRALWKRVVFPFAAACIGVFLTLLLVEAALQLAPRLFSPGVQHLAFSRYDALPGGMYVRERQTRMRLMRANVTMRTYSHGYWWNHATDALGFRSPHNLERRDVLLLGDSLIYGHGVEESQTVAHFLRSEHQVAGYNMGSQGQCLYECYVTYRLYAEELQPEAVVLFVFLNDILDLVNRRHPEEIADPPEIERFNYQEIGKQARELQNRRQPLMTRLAYRLATVRLVKKYLFLRSKSGNVQRQARRGLEPGTDRTGNRMGYLG